jgi:predicted RNA-binding Zn-ribbon protein involved in translation (DUF1610 family)
LWNSQFIAQLDGVKLKEEPALEAVQEAADPKDEDKVPAKKGEFVKDTDGALPQKDYAEEYHRPLKGESQEKTGFAAYGPAADECVKFGPDGLRITLPAGYAGQRPGTGLVTDFGVKGDFEITMSFEILEEPKDAGLNTELSLVVVPQHAPEADVWLKANQNRASLAAQAGTAVSLRRFLATATKWKDETVTDQWGNEQMHLKEVVMPLDVPTVAVAGRLRLVRSGSSLFYCVAEGNSDTFTVLRKFEFGDKDLKNVRILASTGGPKATFDVRVTDWRIRADAFTRVPLGPRPASTPIAWILGASGLAAGLLIGGFLWWRKRRTGDTTRTTPALPEDQVARTAFTSFPCVDCGKTLKAKRELAGKKVKCPHCGKTGPVPEPVSAAIKSGNP